MTSTSICAEQNTLMVHVCSIKLDTAPALMGTGSEMCDRKSTFNSWFNFSSGYNMARLHYE